MTRHKPELTLGATNALIEVDAVGVKWQDLVILATEYAQSRNDDITRADIERAVEHVKNRS